MDRDITDEIAASVSQLADALRGRGFSEKDIVALTAAAMPGIVAWETSVLRMAPSPGPEDRHRPGRMMNHAGEELLRAGAAALRARLGARLGNVSGLDGLGADVIERLAAGPEEDGTDMRLVAVGSPGTAGEKDRAWAWVLRNDPGAGEILDAVYAGRAGSGGNAVYLVTYRIRGE